MVKLKRRGAVGGVATTTTLLLTMLFLATLTGCSRTEKTAEAAVTAESPPPILVIYTYDAFPEPLEQMIVSRFSDEYNITVTVERFQDTGGLYNEVYLAGNDYVADLIIGLDNTYVGNALAEGFFQPYTPAGIESVRPDLLLDPQHRLIPFDYGNIVLNYDAEVLTDPPTTWDELLDPRLRESIVLMNPATSSPGRNFLLLTIEQFGEDGYLDYWKNLRPNILTVTAGWSEGYGLYSQGEAPIVLSYDTSPAYHIAYEDTDRYRNLIINDTGYAQIEFAGISVHAQNVAGAQRAMDFLLSPEFQTEVPLNQFMFPVRDDVTLPEAFTQLDRPATSVHINGERVDERFDAWVADWEEVMR